MSTSPAAAVLVGIVELLTGVTNAEATEVVMNVSAAAGDLNTAWNASLQRQLIESGESYEPTGNEGEILTDSEGALYTIDPFNGEMVYLPPSMQPEDTAPWDFE